MIEAELPDGTVLEFPEGTGQDVIQRVVRQRMGVAVAPTANAAPQKPGLIDLGLSNAAQIAQMFMPSVGITRGGDNGQSAANAGAGLVRGAGSIGATVARPFESAQENAERRTSMDQFFGDRGIDTKSGAYAGGKLAGEFSGTAGIGGALAKSLAGASAGTQAASKVQPLVEALRTGGMSNAGQTGIAGLATRVLGGGISGGATAGLISPEEAGTGAIVGAALPVAAQGAGLAGKALGAALRPSAETRAVAQKASDYGIPVGIGDISESKAVQSARSILRDAPITGSVAQSGREAQQAAFNQAVGKTFGVPEKKLTLEVLDTAKARMGSEFDRIWNNNALQVDPSMLGKMQELESVAAKLPKNEGASLRAEIQDIYSKMTPGADGNLQIAGESANKFQQYLRRRAEGSAGLKNELSDLRQTIISAFNRSVSEADRAALTTNRAQYKAFKTVEPLLRSAELGVAGRSAGDVPAALLPNAVNKSYGNLTNAPLADLSQIGSRFLVDRTPQTGGSARAAIQNTAIGAALMGTGGLPAVVGAIPVGIAAEKALQNAALANRLVNPSTVPPSALAEALKRSLPLTAPVISVQ
ncbi:MAG: hypothetical protein J0H69_16910 [Burkholderiales bacterium]|nr:hypothetical protein [Burkholderiales bacterium]